MRACGRAHILGAEQILDAERHTLQRTRVAIGDFFVRGFSHLECNAGAWQNISVQRLIAGLDRINMRLRNFLGGKILGFQTVTRGGESEVGESAH